MPFSRSNGVDIWYEVKGDGPAMVLVHANPFDHDLWMYQSAHFSTWFKVVGIDIRGYGRSSKVTTPYSLKDMTDDVVGVMGDLEHCTRGARRLQRRLLDRAAARARSSGAVRRRVPGRRQQRARARATRAASTATARTSATTTSSICASWCAPAFADSRLGKHLLNMWVEREPRLKGEAIAQVFMAGNHTATTDRLGTMKVPTLVINGEFDHSLPAGKTTASLTPGAVHKVLPGHRPCLLPRRSRGLRRPGDRIPASA